MLSGHVMSCYVTLSVTTLPLFDTSVTRQISHRFKSQTGLLLLSPITDIFGSLSRSLSLSQNTHPLKADLITLFRNQV